MSTTTADGIAIDEIIDRARKLAARLPDSCLSAAAAFEDAHSRLSQGLLRLAVLGQFNRGKSTFINSLLGLRILPVSVIPVTSVPTEIAWGAELACSVSFFNSRATERANGDSAAVNELLERYVTEEKNPSNLHCVDSVQVYCPSRLLSGGTVIVDTPGFGSTHEHNTHTTLEYLGECDAALFMLSADLPITQMEIEFLRELHRHVPRIFFIYNKVDLLGQSDLELSRRFVETALRTKLAFINDVRLFPVSARNQVLSPDSSNKNEQPTGMEMVRQEILSFLSQEKFFTLAHAIHDKISDSLRDSATVLNADLEALKQPLRILDKKITVAAEDFRRMQASVRQSLAQQQQHLAQVRNTLSEYFTNKSMDIRNRLHDALEQACGERQRRLDVGTLTALLNRLFSDYVAAFAAALVTEIDRTLGLAQNRSEEQLMQFSPADSEAIAVPQENGSVTSFATALTESAPLPLIEAIIPQGFFQRNLLGSDRSSKVLPLLKADIDAKTELAVAPMRSAAVSFVEQATTENGRDFAARLHRHLDNAAARTHQLTDSKNRLLQTDGPRIEELKRLLTECEAIKALLQ